MVGENGTRQDRGRVVQPGNQEAALLRTAPVPVCFFAGFGESGGVFQVWLAVRVQARAGIPLQAVYGKCHESDELRRHSRVWREAVPDRNDVERAQGELGG